MQTDRTRPTLFAKRFLVVMLAFMCAGLGAFIAVPGGKAGAQAPINDIIAFDRDGELFLINTDGTGIVPRGKGYGPAFSPNGAEIAFTFPDTIETNLVYKMGADGMNRVPLTDSFQDRQAAWSPDGSQIAFVSDRVDPEYAPGDDLRVTPRLYLMDNNGNGEQKVMSKAQSQTATHTIEQEHGPVWSPNGSQLAFMGHSRTAAGASRTNIYIVNKDGSGLREVTHFENGRFVGVDRISWSPDGTKIAFQMTRDIHVINVDGLTEPVNLTNTVNRDESDPAFSPSGGRIAYAVNDFEDEAKDGLYIMKSNGQSQTLILSDPIDPISRPAWHPLAQDPTEDPSPPPSPSPSPSPSPNADISINLSASPAKPKLGDNVIYTLIVRNNGPDNATDSFAAFERSANLELVSAIAAQGMCEPSISEPLGTVCGTGMLAAGASTTVTIVVRPTAVGQVGLSGTVGAPPIDPDMTNNSRTVNLMVPGIGCVPEVTNEISGTISRPGNQSQQRVQHTITVRNTSGRTLNGLVHFVFDGLDSSISDGDPRETFFNTRCERALGRPYKSIGVSDLIWHPGQVITLEVDFFNPEQVPVNYNLRVYTGPGFP